MRSTFLRVSAEISRNAKQNWMIIAATIYFSSAVAPDLEVNLMSSQRCPADSPARRSGSVSSTGIVEASRFSAASRMADMSGEWDGVGGRGI